MHKIFQMRGHSQHLLCGSSSKLTVSGFSLHYNSLVFVTTCIRITAGKHFQIHLDQFPFERMPSTSVDLQHWWSFCASVSRFAHVKFTSKEPAHAMIKKMDGQYVHGAKLKVEMSSTMERCTAHSSEERRLPKAEPALPSAVPSASSNVTYGRGRGLTFTIKTEPLKEVGVKPSLAVPPLADCFQGRESNGLGNGGHTSDDSQVSAYFFCGFHDIVFHIPMRAHAYSTFLCSNLASQTPFL